MVLLILVSLIWAFSFGLIKRHLAGVIQPGTTFGLDETLGDTIAITLDRIGLQLAPGARPLVRQTAVADCTDVPR